MAITGGYTLNHGKAYAGMVADGELNNTVTRLNKTGAPIGFGLFVSAGDEFDRMQPATADARIIGVTRRELNHVTQTDGTYAIQDGMDGGVLTVGSIWVQAADEFEVGDQVAVELTAGADLGKAKKAAAPEDALEGATVVGYDADAELVQISLKIGG